MSIMQSHKAGKDIQRIEAYSKSSSDTQCKEVKTRVYFSPDYTGPVHLILGSFVVETADTIEDALDGVKRFSAAAKRCGKPIEIVPVDSSYQTICVELDDWLSNKQKQSNQ